jgi:Protein of unknwon function (DUF3310)
MMPEYKYDEDKYLNDIKKYLDGTYGEHYVAKDIQVVDIWESLGTLESTARDTAIKYLCRYGKKDGKNKKDLLKAIHYIILMMYANREQDQAQRLEKMMKEGKFVAQQDIRDAYERVDYHDSHSRN